MENDFSLYYGVENLSLYFFSNLKNKGFFSCVKKSLLINRFIHKFSKIILEKFHYKESFFLKKINALGISSFYTKELLTKISEKKFLVLFDGLIGTDLMFYLRNASNDHIFVFFWNRITPDTERFLSFLPRNHFFTYSEQDAEKYKIAFVGDFCEVDPNDFDLTLKRTFFFLGRDKGRSGMLIRFGESAIQNGYSIDVDLFADKKKDIFKGECPSFVHLINGYMPYYQYLNEVASSECLLEFEDNNETITMRVIESLLFRKKLITNNQRLKTRPFYNPSDILVLDSSFDFKDIKHFLDCPYQEVDSKILKEFSFADFSLRISKEIDKELPLDKSTFSAKGEAH